MEPLILIGGGGHCRSAIDVIEAEGKWTIVGITDRKENMGNTVSGYEIIAPDDELPGLISKYKHCLVTVGQLKSASLKRNLFEMATGYGATFPVVASPRAVVSNHAQLGSGTIVFHHAVVNSGAVTGVNCIINTGAIVEHDAMVGDHVHIAPGAVVNGHCKVGNGSLLGSGAVVVQQVEIGENVIIGAGSVVNRSIIEPGIYAGVPAKKIR